MFAPATHHFLNLDVAAGGLSSCLQGRLLQQDRTRARLACLHHGLYVGARCKKWGGNDQGQTTHLRCTQPNCDELIMIRCAPVSLILLQSQCTTFPCNDPPSCCVPPPPCSPGPAHWLTADPQQLQGTWVKDNADTGACMLFM